jgi:hypothetical protein
MKYLIVISAICMVLISATVGSVFAENLNLPDGQKIDYFSQGEGYIAVPAGALYTNSPATSFKIACNDGEGGSFGSADNIIIFQFFQGIDGPEYIPMAWFIASPDTTQPSAQVEFYRAFLSGLPAAVVVQVNPALTIANTKTVPDTVLKVERHGNSISAQLTASQVVIYATGVNVGRPATIPAFSVEFNKVDGNIHTDITNYLNPAHGLSGFTQIVKASGFDATGLFTCTSTRWTTTNTPMTDCAIAMHEISIYIPPNLP